MKALTALATAILAMGSPATAAPRPAVEHFGRPNLGGQPLPFSDAVRVGDVLYVSGQLGVGPDGKLPDGIEAQTKQAMENIGAILERAHVGYDRIFHCTAYLADMKDWAAFNKVYVGYFPDGPLPARSAIDVDGLALGGLLELECQAYAPAK
jgi:2-iminobutanoate/2-iminopropanoate deaminase